LALICCQWANPFSFPQLSSGIHALTQLLGQDSGETMAGGAAVMTIAGATGAGSSSGAGGAMANGSGTTTVVNGAGDRATVSQPVIPKRSRAGIATFQTFRTAGILLSRTFDTSPLSANRVPARPNGPQACPGFPNWPIVRPQHETPGKAFNLRTLVAITGASGALYAQRLLDNLALARHEVHVVLSAYAQAVIAEELPDGLRLAPGVKTHGLKSMNVPFASGSNPFDAMVVIPCTMGTLGRIAHGLSEDVLLRAADVMLKERKRLILVPRETPISLVHVKNFELLLLAGATIIPANPSFYTHPQTIEQVVDTVVARVLDHLGVPQKLVPRWQEERE
jgi:4-hydroxy-3-polyprenylbenzoate decarboxylase